MGLADLNWRHAIPTGQCYWSLLDASLKKSQLAYRFEAELPLNVDDLYLSSTQLADGRWAVCGMARQDVDAFIQAQPDHALLWSIGPAAFPEFISTQFSDQDQADALLLQLNICDAYALTKPKQRWQQLSLLVLLAAVIIAACLGFYAASERMAQADAFVEQQRVAELQALQHYFPERAQNRAAAYTALTSALRRLQQQQGDSDHVAQDYVQLAHAMMKKWPAEGAYSIASISFQGQRLSIRGQSADLDVAQALWQALQSVACDGEEWVAAPLQAQQQQERVVFEIHLKPQVEKQR